MPKCPKCGDEATYQTPDRTYWDGNAHYWRYTEETCPGHVASDDPKVCAHCGTHIDSLRPDEDDLSADPQ